MPALTTTQTTEVVIKPQVKRQLLKDLRLWAELHEQEKVIKAAKSKAAKSILDVQTELGEPSIAIEGFKSTITAPMRKKFDAKKFISKGGDLDIYNASLVETSGTAYAKISAPGMREHNEDD